MFTIDTNNEVIYAPIGDAPIVGAPCECGCIFGDAPANGCVNIAPTLGGWRVVDTAPDAGMLAYQHIDLIDNTDEDEEFECGQNDCMHQMCLSTRFGPLDGF